MANEVNSRALSVHVDQGREQRAWVVRAVVHGASPEGDVDGALARSDLESVCLAPSLIRDCRPCRMVMSADNSPRCAACAHSIPAWCVGGTHCRLSTTFTLRLGADGGATSLERRRRGLRTLQPACEEHQEVTPMARPIDTLSVRDLRSTLKIRDLTHPKQSARVAAGRFLAHASSC